MMPDTFTQNQSQSQGNGLGGDTAGRDALAGEKPQNPADVTATQTDVSDDAYVRTMVPEMDRMDSRVPRDNPATGMPDVDAPGEDTPPAVDKTYEGKLVFSPNELNQAGEDKEYFPPEKGHKFDAPKDANAHALTPDIEVAPDNTVKKIG